MTAPEPDQIESHESQEGGGDSTDWKKEARKWESRAKENSQAAEDFKAYKASAESEKQKAQEEIERLTNENKGFKAREERAAWVKEVAATSGVPVDVVSELNAESKEDLEKKAESLKGYFEKNTVPPVPGDGEHPEKITSEKQEFARKLFGRE